MRSATTGFFSTFASTKSLMRHRSSQRLKNVAASLYGSGPCDTVKAVEADGDRDVPRFRVLSRYPPGPDNSVGCLAFTADGTGLVAWVFQDRARIWDVRTGKERL